ncbi:hypothetical protein H0R92_01760 [Treponema sp. OMZ 840]|uniref:hypothetical protein n=1 Tax=Treponema sp. OMZ 840 TaxID=244313 RepID=UPI003D913EB3
MKKLAAFLCMLIFISSFAFSAENAAFRIDSYEKGKPLPSWLKDVRRAEIITFGSLPFTTLGVTLVYSLYRYGANDFNPAYIPNPFPLSSSEAKLNKNEQIGIFTTAAVLSIAIGLTDFIVIRVKDHNKKKLEQMYAEDRSGIRVEEAVPENIKEKDSAQDAQSDSSRSSDSDQIKESTE